MQCILREQKPALFLSSGLTDQMYKHINRTRRSWFWRWWFSCWLKRNRKYSVRRNYSAITTQRPQGRTIITLWQIWHFNQDHAKEYKQHNCVNWLKYTLDLQYEPFISAHNKYSMHYVSYTVHAIRPEMHAWGTPLDWQQPVGLLLLFFISNISVKWVLTANYLAKRVQDPLRYSLFFFDCRSK